MTIATAEIKVYKSEAYNDLSSNGGRMSANVITSGVLGNIFPPVYEAERVAGSTKYRKIFIKPEDADNAALIAPNTFVASYTPGDDIVVLFEATHTDTQDDITGSEDQFGAGQLDSDVLAAVTSIDVAVEDDSVSTIFRIGDTIYITDKRTAGEVDIVSGTGNIETRVLTSVSYSVDVATLGFADGLDNGYAAVDTIVASAIVGSDASFEYDSFVVTSSAGTFDDTTYPITGDNQGSVYDIWTITFTSPTAFTCSGANEGSVGSGNTSSDFEPENSDFSKPYFSLPSAGFGGAYVASDTIVFVTYPVAVPIWCKRVVPAGSAALNPNSWTLGMIGSST